MAPHNRELLDPTNMELIDIAGDEGGDSGDNSPSNSPQNQAADKKKAQKPKRPRRPDLDGTGAITAVRKTEGVINGVCQETGYNYQKETDIRDDPWACLAYLVLAGVQMCYYFQIYIPITGQMLLYAMSLVYIGCANSAILLSYTHVGDGRLKHEKAERRQRIQQRKEGEGQDRSADVDGDEEGGSSDIEFLSLKDAAAFPVFASCSLCGMYVAFKFIGPDWVNFLIKLYCCVAGLLASTIAFTQFFQIFVPTSLDRSTSWRFPQNDVPFWKLMLTTEDKNENKKFRINIASLLGIVAAVVCVYQFFETSHYVANNILAMSFCICGMPILSLNQFPIGYVLLTGLFCYDIFWVFGTDVMVTVAKKFDGPAKLLFPMTYEPLRCSLLGLGDIIIPGFFMALTMRFDAWLTYAKEIGDRDFLPCDVFKPYLKRHFWPVWFCYGLALVTTSFVMQYFRAAQPALLYIVPAIIVGQMLTSFFRGTFRTMWGYAENEVVEAGITQAKEKRRLQKEAKATGGKYTDGGADQEEHNTSL